MSRFRGLLLWAACLAVLGGCGVWIGFAFGPDPPATWSPAYRDCRHLALIDGETGAPLRGIEDIDLDRATGIAWLSAYDRWTVERQAASGADTLPDGGLYPLALARLHEGAERLTVSNAAADWDGAGGLFPHGIGLGSTTTSGAATGGAAVRWLAVVNRRYRRAAGQATWESAPSVELFAVAGDRLVHRASLTDPRLCNANDVVPLDASTLLVSSDRGRCGPWGRLAETVLGLSRGSVLRLALAGIEAGGSPRLTGIVPIVEGLAFANGLALARTEESAPLLLAAATRAKAVSAYVLPEETGAENGLDLLRTVALSGGPDNLFVDATGRGLTALHPSLLRLGLYRYRWFGVATAPTRIVRFNVTDATVETLVDDPSGRLLSAATGAIAFAGLLIAGSVADEGLLVCRPARPRAMPSAPPPTRTVTRS